VKADIAGVVVNYNARDDLLSCVGSLLAEGVGTVIVPDNGSTDGSEAALAARYPEAKWAPTGANLGYGAAADLGAALSDSTYLLVCNPDVVVEAGSLATLRAFLEARPDVAIVGPRIVDGRGALYPSARRFPDLGEAIGHGFLGQFWPGNPFSRRYRMNDWDHLSARPVDWVSGACFLARRTAWEAVGGFDRAYFMYLEDVDLCWRLGRAGWAVVYEPAAQVVHFQGVSADRHPYRMLLAHHVSMWRFATRSTPAGRRWALPVVLPGLAIRLLLTVARRALSGLLSRGRPVPARAEG
jgi:N-acetylglucosaminyl-diphospho-decaprenol L-rhamnosyltransferase